MNWKSTKSASAEIVYWNVYPDLLLLHQFGVWAVINHIFSKDRGGQNSVDFLRIDILQFPIENKIVALSPEVYGSFLSK
jgi:hypothetical protein